MQEAVESFVKRKGKYQTKQQSKEHQTEAPQKLKKKPIHKHPLAIQ